jgi:branched-chain amino acid transport system ATP-binding protein
MSILKTEILTKAFGELRAVDEVSVGFQEGEITSIIGPNGAGKTTFFNLITGRLRPSSGAVYLKEENITGLPPHKILRRGIGRSFQITNIFPGLTTFENVRIGILAYNGKGSNLFSQVSKMNEMNEEVLMCLDAVGIRDEKDTIAGALSHGDQKRLEIALALTSQPDLLLLDEPTAGMNPEETKILTDLIKRISDERGVTVIFTEHDMAVVFSISERIIVMQQGCIIADGKGDEIKDNKQVRAAYLGAEE